MKKFMGLTATLAVGSMLLAAYVLAEQAVPTAGTTSTGSKPKASTTPTAKTKTKKKSQKKNEEVWACPMGDYSGPKTKDGKCPSCGMDLVKIEKSPPKKQEGKKTGEKPESEMTPKN
jgi:hypothetical protein